MPASRCSECERPVLARGWCRLHYDRWRFHGTPHGRTVRGSQLDTFDERLARWVEVGDCWRWLGHINDTGYGRVRWHGRGELAHRWVWRHLVGEVPDGLELDHLCFSRSCVNPDHLEPVTHAVNVERQRPHAS